MYSVHEIVTRPEDIKVGEHDERSIAFHQFLPGTSNKTKMRANHALILIFALCIIVECGGTVSTRVTRTIPFNLFPRWSSTLRNLWSSGRLWDLPRNSAEYFLRLVAAPDTRKKMTFEFRPDDGPRASYAYQSRYGYRGQWLIELLGSGFHPDSVPFRQPVPLSMLVPPAPPR